MPFYQYQCSHCQHQEEVLQKVSDPALTECPACKQPQFAKKISGTAFALKGTGWYDTGYARPAPEKKTEKGTETAS